jgi:rare lipoprotein A
MKVWLMSALLIMISLPQQALCAPNSRVQNRAVQVTQKVQYGIASWYRDREQGRLMASGEPFDENALTAAHRSLPFGTQVTVTNLQNGHSVTVRIKDRGPALANRLIDLSKAAAMRLGFLTHGLTRVQVRVVSLPPVKQNRTEKKMFKSDS